MLRRLTTTLFLAATGTVAIAAPAFASGTVRGADAPGAVPGQYIVVLKDSAQSVDTQAATLTKRFGGTVRTAYRKAVRGFSARLTASAAARLAADPAVSYVEQDRIVTVSGTQSNPPSWGLDRIDQANLPLSKSYTYGGAANVTAYVIDTGVRVSHPDFGGRARSGYDFIDGDANADDCQGHGTHVAGTIGGATYGVAKDVQLVAVRVLGCDGGGSYSQIIAGVDWVTANAVKPAVANMSLGGSAGATLDNAVRNSIASGITYAVAAGNENTDACTKSPGRLAEAITVGATDSTDARASFSNYGSCLDIFAPGASIMSTLKSGEAGRMSGTSMAAPHVAGAAALLLAANPTATPQQIRDGLVAAAPAKVTAAGTGSPTILLNTGGTVAPAPPAPVGCAFTNSYQKKINDLGTIDSNLTVSGCTGKASATSTVKVSVAHPDRGDLQLTLLAPDGTTYALKSATSGDNVADLNATYTVNVSTEDRNGLWKLRVADKYAGDTGTLLSWTLTL